MSEPTSRLNLIQRAMQQVKPKPAENDLQSDAVPALQKNGEASADPSLTRAMPMPPTPMPAARTERGGVPDVRLNYAKLRDLQIMTPDNKSSYTYNEFRAIKRKLVPMTHDPQTKALTRNLILVTSALPGEGKTFTAMNLAIGLAAERNLEVILVDGDVLRSTIGEYFEGPHGEGLLDLLTGSCQQIDDVMHRCADLPNLHVIFAGKHEETSPELLASKRMAEACATLSRRYPECIVVIDTPPVLATSEPVALAMHVHHLIMVVAAGQATRGQIEEALSAVSACPSINLLFNKVPKWQRSNPYSYYYNYKKP
jgi:receptor protein-tyrosine kinase